MGKGDADSNYATSHGLVLFFSCRPVEPFAFPGGLVRNLHFDRLSNSQKERNLIRESAPAAVYPTTLILASARSSESRTASTLKERFLDIDDQNLHQCLAAQEL